MYRSVPAILLFRIFKYDYYALARNHCLQSYSGYRYRVAVLLLTCPVTCGRLIPLLPPAGGAGVLSALLVCALLGGVASRLWLRF